MFKMYTFGRDIYQSHFAFKVHIYILSVLAFSGNRTHWTVWIIELNIRLMWVPVAQRFSIPVLAPPRSAYFVCYSYRFRCLFYSNVSALRSGHHRIFRHDSSSKRTYIYSIQSAYKCARRELKLYIFTEVYDVTLVCAWRHCAAQKPWMNVPKWSKLQRISPAQGVGSNGPCVGSISIGTQFMHGAHF